MNVKAVRVTITDGMTGEEIPADLAVCPGCDGNTWSIFMALGADHSHILCAGCDTSYCMQGAHGDDDYD